MAAGAVLGTAFIEVRPDLQGFGQDVQRGMGTVEGQMRDSGDRAGRSWVDTFKGHMAAIGVTVGLQQVGQFLSGSVGAARESERAVARLETVFASVVDTTGAGAQHALDYAASLSEMTAVEDETILQGQAMLATFANVSSAGAIQAGVFDRATAAAVDMAATGFGSVESNAVLLGKALQDPTERVAALARVGVTLTDSQVAMVESFEAAGDTVSAQGVILGAIESQVGGVAAGIVTDADRMNLAWGEMQEQVGTALMPALNAFGRLMTGTIIPVISRLVTVLGNTDDALASTVEWIQENRSWLIPLGVAVLALTSNLIANTAATIANSVATTAASVATKAWGIAQAILNAVLSANPIMLVVAAIAALVAGIIWAYQNVDWFRSAVDTAFAAVAVAFNWVLDAAKFLWNWISENWSLLLAIITGPIGLAVRFIIQHWDAIVSAFRTAWDTVVSIVTGAVSAVVGAITGLISSIVGMASSVFNAAVGFGRAIIDGIRSGLSAVGGFVSDIGAAVFDAVKSAINTLIRMLNTAIPNSLGWGPASIDLPDEPFPYLHDGGVVPGRPGQDVWSLLRAGEYVLTPEQMAAVGAGGPAVAIGSVVVADPVDVDLLVARLSAAITAGRL